MRISASPKKSNPFMFHAFVQHGRIFLFTEYVRKIFYSSNQFSIIRLEISLMSLKSLIFLVTKIKLLEIALEAIIKSSFAGVFPFGFKRETKSE